MEGIAFQNGHLCSITSIEVLNRVTKRSDLPPPENRKRHQLKYEKVDLRMRLPVQEVPVNQQGFMTYEGRMFTTSISSAEQIGDEIIALAHGTCVEIEEVGGEPTRPDNAG